MSNYETFEGPTFKRKAGPSSWLSAECLDPVEQFLFEHYDSNLSEAFVERAAKQGVSPKALMAQSVRLMFTHYGDIAD